MKITYFIFLLFLFSSAVSSAQKIPPVIQWQKSLGGSKIDRSYTVIRTLDNGYLVVGESFSNDGDVTGHHGSTDSSDAWVVKLDTAGTIQWQRSYGGSRNDRFVDVIQANNGDFICVGSSESDNGDASGLHSTFTSGNYTANADLWAMRINSTGSIIWSKLLGGTDVEDAQVIRKASDGGGYTIAGNSKSIDGDVTGNNGYMDVWLLKINESGVLQWQKSYGDNNNQFATDLIVTSDGNYVISGYSTSVGLGGCQVIYSFYSDLTLKVTAAGNVIWQSISLFPCGNPGSSDYCANLIEMPSGQFYYVGNHINATTESYPSWKMGRINPTNGSIIGVVTLNDFYSGNIFSPVKTGPHNNRLLPDSTILSCASVYAITTPNGNIDGSLSLINTKPFSSPFDTVFFYRKRYGGSNTEQFAGIEVINEQQFIATGFSNSNNGDVSGNHGDYDCWVVKFSALNKIKGKAFIDNNGNGIKENTEPYAKNYYVESSKNGLVIGNTTDNNGNFLNNVDTGTYTTTLKLKKPYYSISPVSRQSVFTALNKTDSFDFAMVPIPAKNDLEVNVQGLNILRPGFKSQYSINYSNTGTATVSGTQLRFIKPPKMDYISAVPLPALLSGDTITWNTGTLAALDSSFIILTLQAQPLPGVDIGNRLSFSVQIDPISGDQTPADNRDTIWQVARGSFDPNDKTENYDGTVYTNQLKSFQSFDYTVRFQNTGTDTAFSIIIRDTLADKLNAASMEMVAASHPYTFTLKNNKYCTWTFNNIKLVDSNTNAALSHGYISYRIKPKTILLLSDTIVNTASIYFDFNPAIKTNTQLTVVKSNPPSRPVVTGLQPAYCSNSGMQKGKISNLPVAGSGITASVKLDATVLPVAADSTFSFDAGVITAGSHQIKILFSNSSGSDSILFNIIIAAAVTPDVNVSANIINVVNLTDPVIITAANAAGGGTSPKYTFAKDKAITNILQAEGSASTVTIQPNTLTVGSNWIYVRMKTSDTCYTTQTNIDSVKIERSTVTGLTDVDFPNQLINIYPNPFANIINISGLNTGKTYTINISNTSGQKVYSMQVANSSTLSISKTGLQSGRYWLSIFDYKKQKLIGTVAVIKE